MKNNKGQITVESLIAVTVFILLASCLQGLLGFVGVCDYATQIIYDEVNQVSQYNYCYEKIGVLSIEDIPYVKSKIPSELNFWFDDKMSLVNGVQKMIFLKGLVSIGLMPLEEHPKISDVKIISFKMKEELLNTVVTYNQKLPLGLTVNQRVEMTIKLWYLGDQKNLIDTQTLSELFSSKKKESKNTVVYVTKTGSKYHLKGCFYLERDGTDKDGISSMSLESAQNSHEYSPCSRCILKEWSPWK